MIDRVPVKKLRQKYRKSPGKSHSGDPSSDVPAWERFTTPFSTVGPRRREMHDDTCAITVDESDGRSTVRTSRVSNGDYRCRRRRRRRHHATSRAVTDNSRTACLRIIFIAKRYRFVLSPAGRPTVHSSSSRRPRPPSDSALWRCNSLHAHQYVATSHAEGNFLDSIEFKKNSVICQFLLHFQV